MTTPEILNELARLRARASSNELSQEDCQRVVLLLREARGKAYVLPKAAKAPKAAAQQMDASKLLEGL